ncbi:MAG: triose-phosphate isomerase [Candidatus Heimdallarchaeota archaeon]
MANFKVVAQNFDLVEEARTGEITCYHLFQANASGTLVGHPETDDTLQTVNKKINEIISLQETHPSALPFNVIMLGETFEEFSSNSLYDIAQLLKGRCSEIFNDIPAEFIKRALLIYEPKWAVNPNDPAQQLPPSPKLITQVTNKMRDFLTDRLGSDGLKVSLMYGEVSTSDRAVEILANENLQGLMLGAACTTSDQVLDFVKAIQFAYNKRKIILVCNFKSFELAESYHDYLSALAIVPDNFTIYFASPATAINHLCELIK